MMETTTNPQSVFLKTTNSQSVFLKTTNPQSVFLKATNSHPSLLKATNSSITDRVDNPSSVCDQTPTVASEFPMPNNASSETELSSAEFCCENCNRVYKSAKSLAKHVCPQTVPIERKEITVSPFLTTCRKIHCYRNL